VKIQVITHKEMADRNARFRASGLERHDFELAEQAARRTALFLWHDGGFSWLCPGCGSWYYGQLGDQPVSGWDAPRWVNSGGEETPTLTPSLGCGGWKRGTCLGGHYWLRGGELVTV
jgi:hypothetical protein